MMLLIGEMGVDSYIYAFSNNVFPRDSFFFYLTSLYLYCKKKKKGLQRLTDLPYSKTPRDLTMPLENT